MNRTLTFQTQTAALPVASSTPGVAPPKPGHRAMSAQRWSEVTDATLQLAQLLLQAMDTEDETEG